MYYVHTIYIYNIFYLFILYIKSAHLSLWALFMIEPFSKMSKTDLMKFSFRNFFYLLKIFQTSFLFSRTDNVKKMKYTSYFKVVQWAFIAFLQVMQLKNTFGFIQLVKIWTKKIAQHPLYSLNLNNIKYLYLHFIDVVQIPLVPR